MSAHRREFERIPNDEDDRDKSLEYENDNNEYEQRSHANQSDREFGTLNEDKLEEENDEDLKAFIGHSKPIKSRDDSEFLQSSDPQQYIKSKSLETKGSKRMMPQRALDALYRSHKFPNEPDSKEILDRFDAPTRIGYQYGQLIWGWFIAPLDGEYIFYTACDDACDLYMSPDEGKDHIRKIISQNRWSLHNQWDK